VESILKLAIALYITYGVMNLPVGLTMSTENLGIIYSTFDKLIIYGFLMAVLSVLMLLVRRVYCHRKYAECEFNFKKYYNKGLFRQISHFVGWSFLGSSSSMVANYGQGIVMNVFFGTAVNAVQGVAVQVSGQLSVFSNTLVKALNPIIHKSEGAGDRALMIKATMMGSKVSFFLLMVLHVPILIEMPYILSLWLKNVPDFTVIFCRLLLIRTLIEQLFIPLASAISAVGNIKYFQISTSMLSFFPLVIAYILFEFGHPPFALYIVFIVYSILFAIITLYFSKKICQLPLPNFFFNVIVRCVVAFILILALSLVPYYLIEDDLFRLIIVILTCIFSYVVIVYSIGFSSEERAKITILLEELPKLYPLNKINSIFVKYKKGKA
jgi:O-antigen/teichoic acid export membrane protein